MVDGVEFRSDARPTLEQFIGVYRTSTLAERRPVDEPERMARMLAEADLLVTAWDGDELVGVARSLTDHVYVTYLSDLAVAGTHQRRGIGRRLVHETVAACEPGCRLVLLAAPGAVDYYPKLGFEQHPSAWMLGGFPLRGDEEHGS
jgi:predicted N-acetyltransferase YhbS